MSVYYGAPAGRIPPHLCAATMPEGIFFCEALVPEGMEYCPMHQAEFNRNHEQGVGDG